jgi:CHAT domain-containing protein/tetratricopeptide (TPR) repeat protein
MPLPYRRTLAAPALIAVIVASASQQPSLPGNPGDVVRAAERAVATRRAAAVRQDWLARLRREPGNRLARLGVATFARFAYDYAAADSFAAPLLARGGARPDAIAAWARIETAIALAQQWRLGETDSLLTIAAREGQMAGDGSAEGAALARLAVLRGRTQGVDSGLALLDRSARVLPPTDSVGRALALAYRAQLLLARGTPGAGPLADSALRLARRAGAPRVEGLVYNVMGREQLRVRRADSAEVLFGRAIERLRDAGDLAGYAGSLQWRGYLLRSRGELGAAERDLRAAIAVGPIAGQIVLGWTEMNLGQVAILLNDWTEARRHIMSARALLDSAHDRWGGANATRLEAHVRWAVRDWAGADSLLRSAETQLAQSGNTSQILDTRVQRLRYALARRDWTRASEMLALSRDSTFRERSGAYVDLDYYDALLALGTGRPNDARRALDRSRREGARSGQPPTFSQLARAAEAEAMLGRLDAAEAKLRAAISTFERYRSSRETREQRLAALTVAGDDGDEDVGVATVVAALARAGRTDAAFAFAERTKARELLHGMARREALRDPSADRPQAREAALAKVYTRPVSLAELQAALPESTAVVHFNTGAWNEPTTAFVLTRDGATSRVLPPADSLVDPVRRLVLALQAKTDARPQARLLGAAIAAPIAGALPPGVSRLVIVPSAPLNTLPFDVLELPDGRRMIERFEVSYAPSASVYAALRRRALDAANQGQRMTGGRGVLAFGAPERPRRSGVARWDTLPPLPSAAAEAREVGRVTPRSLVRLGRDASEAALKRASLSDVSILHFASHAVVDPAGLRGTALLLAPGGGDDGIVRPEEISGLSLDADLVVLSACATALSGGHAGDEGLRGLVAPLIEAGARSVAATLWAVDDEAQRLLMRRFYQRLARGESTAGALRGAKLDSMRDGASPRDWASLVLWGDPLTHPLADVRQLGGNVRPAASRPR